MNYTLTTERRTEYRIISREAHLAKKKALAGNGLKPVYSINKPKLDPKKLMPQLPLNNLRALSLFSGGGGLDLGFDRAGYTHVASYDWLKICGDTIKFNRPNWSVFSGDIDGDVRNVDWSVYKSKVDVIHGGPPCQPFSIAGSQKGSSDERNMWPEFIRAVNTIKPKVFVAENVPGMLNAKFRNFIKFEIIKKLPDYYITYFKISSAMFGVPQDRQRVIFVGFRNKKHADVYKQPLQTHTYAHLKKKRGATDGNQTSLFEDFENKEKTMGVREALGLEDIGCDALAPTIRSAFTGKRNTTSILNGKSGQEYWANLKIWPNGVAENREAARNFVPKNMHRRLSVQDCAILQGFPSDWIFQGAAYKILGQIGNSVAPPKGYAIARSILEALKN